MSDHSESKNIQELWKTDPDLAVATYIRQRGNLVQLTSSTKPEVDFFGSQQKEAVVESLDELGWMVQTPAAEHIAHCPLNDVPLENLEVREDSIGVFDGTFAPETQEIVLTLVPRYDSDRLSCQCGAVDNVGYGITGSLYDLITKITGGEL